MEASREGGKHGTRDSKERKNSRVPALIGIVRFVGDRGNVNKDGEGKTAGRLRKNK